jgi:hypothetical protein
MLECLRGIVISWCVEPQMSPVHERAWMRRHALSRAKRKTKSNVIQNYLLISSERMLDREKGEKRKGSQATCS